MDIGITAATADDVDSPVRLYERLGFGGWTREPLARVDD